MSKYSELINKELMILEDAPAPIGPGGMNDVPMDPGAPPSDMSLAGGMPGQQDPAPPEMDNSSKRSSDPIAYTEQLLKTLIDADEGVTPEMFNDFIDTFGVGLSKIRDKDGFKKYYHDFYQRLRGVVEVSNELKNMYKHLNATMQDVLSTQTTEPNNAGNDEGAKGPGV